MDHSLCGRNEIQTLLWALGLGQEEVYLLLGEREVTMGINEVQFGE